MDKDQAFSFYSLSPKVFTIPLDVQQTPWAISSVVACVLGQGRRRPAVAHCSEMRAGPMCPMSSLWPSSTFCPAHKGQSVQVRKENPSLLNVLRAETDSLLHICRFLCTRGDKMIKTGGEGQEQWGHRCRGSCSCGVFLPDTHMWAEACCSSQLCPSSGPPRRLGSEAPCALGLP